MRCFLTLTLTISLLLGMMPGRAIGAEDATEAIEATTALSGEQAVAVDGTPSVVVPSPMEETDSDSAATVVEVETRTGASFYEKMAQGGVIVLVLLFISVALLSFTIERLQNLKRRNIVPADFASRARELWQRGQFKQLRVACESDGSTLASIVRALVMHRKSTSLELSQVAGDIASADMRAHMQKIIPFALVATIAPLLGLLGTVSGMIESFEVVAIAGSMGDASVLADGISKALITTAVGLIVAVPAIALFNFFKSRTTRIALALDTEVNMLIGEWFLEEVEDADDEAVAVQGSSAELSANEQAVQASGSVGVSSHMGGA